ncbi:MAG: hypothetical protein HOV77_21570 [Hamadaea sp.]|uniref:hypothetical protein n=1 Tax=Hamadaea sp. TaxID=2024425 RepID=UPI0018594934|nr:hypothetical protein [Hamadaea sp.]NUT21772.1 hypothetical protein [Hamadaea sp.]
MTIRRKIALAACVAVAVLGSAFLVTVIAQGVQPGSETWYGTDARVRKDVSTTEVAYVFAPGSRFTFGTSIRNPGPWPVTIVDIAANEVFSAVDVSIIDRSEPMTVPFGPDAARPFAAVTLPAGGEIAVFLTVMEPAVEMSPGSTTYFSDITVTYEVFGFGKLRRVPIGFDVGVYVPDAQVHG